MSVMFKEEADLRSFVNTQIIHQAGLDFESKPMLVCCACNLPDPKLVNYDNMLKCMTAQLDNFVESDYVIVLFAGAAKFKPGWTWLFRAYRALERKYKKHLKNLYIVHPTYWSKMILDIMNAIISPKFGKKITYVYSLSQLGNFVPINQFKIPAPVLELNKTIEPNFSADKALKLSSTHGKVFGKNLQSLMGVKGEKGIPAVVKDCVKFLMDNGLDSEGIFRRSPSSTQLKQAKDIYDNDEDMSKNPIIKQLFEGDIHLSAALLKLFFRDLELPLFPSSLYPHLKEIENFPLYHPSEETESPLYDQTLPPDTDKTRIIFIRAEIFRKLPSFTISIMAFLFSLLKAVRKNEQKNLMSSQNLAMVWAPNFVRSNNIVQDLTLCGLKSAVVPDIAVSPFKESPPSSSLPPDDSKRNYSRLLTGGGAVGMAVFLCIERYDEVFEGVK